MTRKKTDRKVPPNGCKCTGCVSGDRYKWAKIMECKCCCHDSSEPSGHSSLCCEFPNGIRKNNPYLKLENSDVYKKQRDDYYKDDYIKDEKAIDKYNESSKIKYVNKNDINNIKSKNPIETAIDLADKYGKGALKFAKEKRFAANAIPSMWFWDEVIKRLKLKQNNI